MKTYIYNFLYFSILLSLFSSCTTKRNLVYFDDVDQSSAYQMAITNAYAPKIQSGDIMAITVSSLDPTSNTLFNTGVLQGSASSSAATTNIGKEGYLVGSDGNINFPIVGKIQLQGLTLEEANQKMQEELIKYVKEPIVNLRYLNFKVTVIGEVNSPGSFTVDNERINLLEALGNAGDMTAYGKRENVLVIREVDGQRNMVRVNLNSSTAFNSPYFYLQQNDLVYVEPDVMKEKQVSRDNYYLATTASIVTILTLILTRIF